MASRQHQRILGLVIRQMRLHGCSIVYAEGRFLRRRGMVGVVPPRVLRHRPDALGILSSGQICIGDAKTASDVKSTRTIEQVEDFTRIRLNGMPCEVFLGVTNSVEPELRAILQQVGVLDSPHVHVLPVPVTIVDD